MKEIITIIKIDDNGNVIGTSTETKVIEEKKEEKTHEYSQYARCFDDSCIPHWRKDPSYNLVFLRLVENHCNDLLKLNGGLYLNDVYGMLGMHKTEAGEVVGWIYNEKNPIGDNFVDFGIYDVDDNFHARNADFINGFTSAIILDFNVDGDISGKFKRTK